MNFLAEIKKEKDHAQLMCKLADGETGTEFTYWLSYLLASAIAEKDQKIIADTTAKEPHTEASTQGFQDGWTIAEQIHRDPESKNNRERFTRAVKSMLPGQRPIDATQQIARLLIQTHATGQDVAEVVSYAVTLADKKQNAGLLDHRPGSWEAEHVRALILPHDMVD